MSNIHTRALSKRVSDFDLSVRAQNCLKQDGVEYVYQLVEKTASDFRGLQRCGRITVEEIETMLAELNLSLGMDIGDFTRHDALELRDKHKNKIEKIGQSKWQALYEDALMGEVQTVESELKACLQTIGVKGERQNEIFATLHGWDGMGRKTFEDTGKKCGGTKKQWVDQVNSKFTERFQSFAPRMVMAEKALDYIENNCFRKKSDIEKKLVEEKLTSSIFDISGLYSLFELQERQPSWRIDKFHGVDYVMLPDGVRYIARTRSKADRLVSRYGYATIEELVGELCSENVHISSDDAYSILSSFSDLQWIDKNKCCFYTKTKQNRLTSAVRKMMSVSHTMHVETLRNGLIRAPRARILRVPEKETLLNFCSALGIFAVNGDIIESTLNPEYELAKQEYVLYEIFRQHGPILTSQELKPLAANRGIIERSLSRYLSNSPLITELRPKEYALLGSKIDSQNLPTLETA